MLHVDVIVKLDMTGVNKKLLPVAVMAQFVFITIFVARVTAPAKLKFWPALVIVAPTRENVVLSPPLMNKFALLPVVVITVDAPDTMIEISLLATAPLCATRMLFAVPLSVELVSISTFVMSLFVCVLAVQ